eukprot:Gb_08732 [translate_table: standard]
MAHIQNPLHHPFRPNGSGLKRGPWIEGNFYNNGHDLTRKFQDVGHSYTNGPPSKRRREGYPDNSLPLTRRTEEERFCIPSAFNNMPSLIEDIESINGNNNKNNNGLAREEETNCCEGTGLYFSRDTIERLSPSRRDGIDLQEETSFRFSYASFLQTLGMRLQLPQTTIATAVVLCHRFFHRRSHASHDRFLIATACMFLVAKSEETPRPLNSVLIVSYELCHKHDLANFHYCLPNDWFEQYKQRVLAAENMILTTLDFELTVQHPYRPLMSVLNKIGLSQTAMVHVAWNLINEGLRSSLCLQFKPHHIAAGAAFLAAKVLNFDLSSNQGLWQEFQTTPTILQDVVQQLTELF